MDWEFGDPGGSFWVWEGGESGRWGDGMGLGMWWVLDAMEDTLDGI